MTVISMAVSSKFLLWFFRALLRRVRETHSVSRKGKPVSQGFPSVRKCPLERLPDQTLLFDIEGGLLKSSSPFPYFMLVAFEAGGIFRAILLLLAYPFICFMSQEVGLKIMVLVSFCGVKKDGFRVGRAVLPKFFLEDVDAFGFEVLAKARKRVAVSCLPLVMVESFLKDYLNVDLVLGRELKVVRGYYSGLMEEKKGLALEEVFGETMVDVGIGSIKSVDYHFLSSCKEMYLVNELEKRNGEVLPKEKYPTPVIFHDGRLAFSPTPLATLAMFIWLPLGFSLAIFRSFLGILLPYKIALLVLSFTGVRFRLKPTNLSPLSLSTKQGLLFVCTHRTLLDPLCLCFALSRPITAVTYSLSRVSELLAPIKTVRLTRNRVEDGKRMKKLLSHGDLVVCPEGTTCREPFLLRFSPLFAELTDEIVPVAMNAHVSMFYGTTAGGLKCLDPLFFFMNPFPSYDVELLEKLPCDFTCSAGGKSSFEVANHVQRELGAALGFECTRLTRKDKYLMLAGNEGVVSTKKPNNSDCETSKTSEQIDVQTPE